MNLPRLLCCLLLVPTIDPLCAVQMGTVETRDGRQLNGAIEFSKETVTIKAAGGESQSVPLAEMRLATFSKDPADQAAEPEVVRNGLRGRYYSNIKHEDAPVERIDAVVSFDWGESAPIEGVTPNGFSVRWEGEVEPPVSGEITFEVESDDGSRLWVGGKKLIDHWQAQSATVHSGKIVLEAGRRYPIKLEYYDAWSMAIARLRWRAEGLPHDIISAKHLFPLPLNSPSTEPYQHEVKLKSGSNLPGKITLADSKRIQLETADGTIVIPAPAVGYLRFAHSWGADLGGLLERKPPGVAFLNRDYAEGKFLEFKDGVAKMESVLFGAQSIHQAELRAIKLADQKAKPAKMWALTTADTRLLLDSVVTLPDGRLKIRDNSGYHLTIPAGQIRMLRSSD